jgi:hypothetical protein
VVFSSPAAATTTATRKASNRKSTAISVPPQDYRFNSASLAS